jgi:hypothetical protein
MVGKYGAALWHIFPIDQVCRPKAGLHDRGVTGGCLSFAEKDLKVGVLGISGNHCKVDFAIVVLLELLAFSESVS